MKTAAEMAVLLAEKAGGVPEGPLVVFPGTHGVGKARAQLHLWGYRDRYAPGPGLATVWTPTQDLPAARVEALTVTFRERPRGTR